MRDQVGGNSPSPTLLQPVGNMTYYGKPVGGMWTPSLVRGQSHWQRICANPKGRLAYLSQYWNAEQPYVLHVRDDARVLHIKNQDDIGHLPITQRGYTDFEKLAQEHDGIHVLKKAVHLFDSYDVV